MELQPECAYCWQSYSLNEDKTPRVLQCGHSLCSGCLGDSKSCTGRTSLHRPCKSPLLTVVLYWVAGRVLTTNARGGLRCPTCGQLHAFSDTPSVAAVPRNSALISSLERLQQRGAAGGLLAPESLVIGDRLPGTTGTAAVYAGILNLHNRQVQVCQSKPLHQDNGFTLCLKCSTKQLSCLPTGRSQEVANSTGVL